MPADTMQADMASGPTVGGIKLGEVVTQSGESWSFDGAAVSAKATVTNSTGGTTNGTALAAGVGIQTFEHPLTSLVTGLSTSAVTLMNGFVPGFRGSLLSIEFITTVAGTGANASQAFNLKIGSTATTGGVLTLTLASQNAIGNRTTATAITADNTFAATDAISLVMAASGTVFTAGAGYFIVRLKNLDTCDAFGAVLKPFADKHMIAVA